IQILTHIVQKQIDGGQRDRLRRKLVIRRGEADLHLLSQGRRKLPPKQRFERIIQRVDHVESFLSLSSDAQRGQSSRRMSGLMILFSKSNQILLSFRQS